MNSQANSVRIRFLSDLRKDYYIQVSETQYATQEKTVLSLYENVSKEREIFLRASLQLLDLKEGSRIRDRVPSTRYNQKIIKSNEEENNMHDVIRLGYLKKCSNSNSLGLSSSVSWKTKYVELRHGRFTYSDCASDCSLNDLTENDPTAFMNKRVIDLSSETCECFTLAEDPSGTPAHSHRIDCIFVLIVKGGSRRLFMAANSDECKEWVRNIRSALVGHQLFHHLPASSSNRRESDAGSQMLHDDGASENIMLEERSSFITTTSLTTWLSMEGAAAPYSRNMSVYLELKDSFSEALDEERYKEVLRDMLRENFHITIPVLFVKSKSTGNHFALSAQDSLTSHNFIGKECSSQIWKDLQRDRIVINGDEVTGELGAEAMVGALVRHISDNAEIIKQMEESSSKETRTDSLQNTAPQLPYHHQHNPFASKFTVNDAQIVECARDLLVLCNRTQSGGDTYFCVDSLFRGENSKDLCLLAPYSPEAEPLHFKVDIVEIHKEHVPTLHRKSYHPRDNTAIGSFKDYESSSRKHEAVANGISESLQSSPTVTHVSGRMKVESQEAPTVSLFSTGSSTHHDHSSEENKRRPQLNLAEILEEGGYFSDRRRISDTEDISRQMVKLGDDSTHVGKNLSHQCVQLDQDSNSDGTHQISGGLNDSGKVDIPQLLLVSNSKDDQSILSELTFDTFMKHRDAALLQSETVIQEQSIPTSGEEESSHLKDRPAKINSVKNKSLLNKIGKRLKLPKLADLEGINSPFGKRRPSASLRSESSGDEKVPKHPANREGHVHFSKVNQTDPHDRAKSNKIPQKTLCIRVQVQAKSKFRLCTLNPSGVEELDTWAIVSGTFYQSFYIVGDGSGHLGIADRLVTIHVDSSI